MEIVHEYVNDFCIKMLFTLKITNVTTIQNFAVMFKNVKSVFSVFRVCLECF